LTPSFHEVIAASDVDRRDLFLGAAARLGTAVQNVEKDFWVCWTLDALFNGLAVGGPRLLFKGGTSLSKAFGLISRFSEDIDLTVFRDDLGQAADVADLTALSGKKRGARLEAIRTACQTYIAGPLTEQFTQLAASVIPEARFRLEPDPDDTDGQTLLFWYPAVTATGGDYVRSAVKIESGAKSALDPHVAATVKPYVAQDVTDLDLTVANVTTVKPERTFWDKVIILHGLRQWHDRHGELRHGGQRISRHYYDVYQLSTDAGCIGARMAGRSRARDRLRSACVTVLRQRGPGAQYRDPQHFHPDTQRGDAGRACTGLCGHVRDDLRRNPDTRCGARQYGKVRADRQHGRDDCAAYA